MVCILFPLVLIDVFNESTRFYSCFCIKIFSTLFISIIMTWMEVDHIIWQMYAEDQFIWQDVHLFFFWSWLESSWWVRGSMGATRGCKRVNTEEEFTKLTKIKQLVRKDWSTWTHSAYFSWAFGTNTHTALIFSACNIIHSRGKMWVKNCQFLQTTRPVKRVNSLGCTFFLVWH